MKREYVGGLRRRALDSSICALLAVTPSAFAQQALPDPSVELRRQQDNEAARRALVMPTDRLAPKDLRAEEGERLPEGESPCFDIKDLRLVGPDAAGFTWALKDLAGPQGDDPPQGRCLGVQGINLVQKRLQNAIMARGYVTTRVLGCIRVCQHDWLSQESCIDWRMPEQPKPLSEASSPARPAFCGNSMGVRGDAGSQIVQCSNVGTASPDASQRCLGFAG